MDEEKQCRKILRLQRGREQGEGSVQNEHCKRFQLAGTYKGKCGGGSAIPGKLPPVRPNKPQKGGRPDAWVLGQKRRAKRKRKKGTKAKKRKRDPWKRRSQSSKKKSTAG